MSNLSANLDTADKPGLTKEELQEVREREWNEIEELVMQYQAQFNKEDRDEETIETAKEAAEKLNDRFYPMFKKYLVLLKSGQINFNDKEMKSFVSLFMDDDSLKRALRRKKQKAVYRNEIYQKFNFIKETYGSLSEDEIMVDFSIILLNMAKRYKQMGRNFCAYFYNSFRYEVARHIKKFITNPINIPYNHIEFEDYMGSTEEPSIENDFEERFYEDSMGIPDMTWVAGNSCSKLFKDLDPIERKILIKYYLEDWNDRQISESFGIHINTVNQKRRQAINKIAEKLGIDEKDIKRSRKSGKKAIIPTID